MCQEKKSESDTKLNSVWCQISREDVIMIKVWFRLIGYFFTSVLVVDFGGSIFQHSY